MDKMLEFTISGSYKTAQKDIIDFENIKGVVPFQDEDVAMMHVRSRYAARWIKEAKLGSETRYPERIQRVREVHIDDIKETTGVLSFAGKNIKDLTFEEIQDLCVAFDLRRVPLYKASDLRNSRLMAYVDYTEKVLKHEPVKYNAEGFNFAKLPAIIIGGGTRREAEKKVTNEDIINAEMNSTSEPKSTLTKADLIAIGKEKDITFGPNTSYDTMYQKLFGQAA